MSLRLRQLSVHRPRQELALSLGFAQHQLAPGCRLQDRAAQLIDPAAGTNPVLTVSRGDATPCRYRGAAGRQDVVAVADLVRP